MFLILSFAIHAIGSLKTGIRSMFYNKSVKVLSVAKNFYVTNDFVVDVYKVKRANNIYIEIYSTDSGSLIQKIQFPDSYDTYFYSEGVSSNLFLDDVDKDNKMDLVIPLYNKSLEAKLHVLSYNELGEKFSLLSN
tara:strand:+ start:954 stop:1358 length:405 start_codon:yes stop_codon:yes gene_type:complete